MSGLPLSALPTVWQGSVKPWECDQMGHLNSRFYFDRLREGLASFAGRLGMPDAYRPEARLTLACPRLNVRFIREARLPQALEMKMGVVESKADALTLFAVILAAHAEEVMASFVLHVVAENPANGAAQPLPDVAVRAAANLGVVPPAALMPRSYDTEGSQCLTPADFSLPAYRRIACGTFLEEACDCFGRMRLDEPMSRLSDGMVLFMDRPRQIVVDHTPEPPTRVGGAMLETKIEISQLPRIGDAFELRAAITRAEGKTMMAESWIVSPDSQQVFVVLRTTSVVFDLDARAIVPVPAAAGPDLKPFIAPSSF